MTRVQLLEQLKAETISATKDLVMPTAPEKGGEPVEQRAAAVHLMRLPDGRKAQKKAPYIIHQLITGSDKQKPTEKAKSTAVVRSIFCVYSEDDEEGGLMLLNLMERCRIHLLRKGVIGEQFVLNLDAGIECMAYPDDTAPFFAGEMVSNWNLPAVEREVDLISW